MMCDVNGSFEKALSKKGLRGMRAWSCALGKRCCLRAPSCEGEAQGLEKTAFKIS
jgi:hypothetical protein